MIRETSMGRLLQDNEVHETLVLQERYPWDEYFKRDIHRTSDYFLFLALVKIHRGFLSTCDLVVVVEVVV